MFMAGCTMGENLAYQTQQPADNELQRAEPYLNKIVLEDIGIRSIASNVVQSCTYNNKECHLNSIYRYIAENYKYYSDPRSNEFIQTPSETMGVKGGDCEDLSILLISLLENLGIKTFLVLTPDHAYALACGIDVSKLRDEIILSPKKEVVVFDETISLDPFSAKYYPGSAAELTEPIEMKYEMQSNLPIDILFVPSEESLSNWAKGKEYKYYPRCSKEKMLKSAGSCEIIPGGIMLVNMNDARTTVGLKISTIVPTLEPNEVKITSYSIKNETCVIIDPTALEDGYPGFNTNSSGEKVAFDPVTKEYVRLS